MRSSRVIFLLFSSSSSTANSLEVIWTTTSPVSPVRKGMISHMKINPHFDFMFSTLTFSRQTIQFDLNEFLHYSPQALDNTFLVLKDSLFQYFTNIVSSSRDWPHFASQNTTLTHETKINIFSRFSCRLKTIFLCIAETEWFQSDSRLHGTFIN